MQSFMWGTVVRGASAEMVSRSTQGRRSKRRLALDSARLRDFLVRSLLLFHATFREIQSYEDLHLNTYLWRLLGSLFQLPTIALFAQNAVHARANLPARRWIR